MTNHQEHASIQNLKLIRAEHLKGQICNGKTSLRTL